MAQAAQHSPDQHHDIASAAAGIRRRAKKLERDGRALARDVGALEDKLSSYGIRLVIEDEPTNDTEQNA